MNRVLIFDGHNTFIRNWMVVPTMDNDGNPVGGITGFLRTLKNLTRDCKPTKIVVVWDGPGGSRRRRSVFSEYKEGRKPRANRAYDFESNADSIKNMGWQREQLKQLLDLLGVAQVEVPDVEADDVIAYICKFSFPELQKVVVSTDKDLLQLVDGKTIIYTAAKKELITVADVKSAWQCLPENFVYMKAIMGDGSDNIDGIHGWGPKKVATLFPFICERPIELRELKEYAEANVAKKARYKDVIDNWDLVTKNVALMQLSSPNMSVHTARLIDSSLRSVAGGVVMSEFRLALVRLGLSIVDQDFFSVFKEFQARIQS